MYERKAKVSSSDALRPRPDPRDVRIDGERIPSDPDAEFFESVRLGRWQKAFESLCDRHCAYMLSMARRYEIAGGMHSACDIVQEYLICLFRGFVEARFTLPTHHLRCYLAMGVHRVGSACRRREAVRATVERRDESVYERDPVDPRTAPPQISDRIVWLASALPRLAPHHLEILRLRCVDGFDHESIAVRLGIPTESVRSRLRAAKAALRAALDRVHPRRERRDEAAREAP